MADDRLLCCRWESIAATKSDNVMWRSPPISFRLLQNASSRLTLVLWPRITIERLATGDFITTHLLFVEFRNIPTQDWCPQAQDQYDACRRHCGLDDWVCAAALLCEKSSHFRLCGVPDAALAIAARVV